MFGKLELSNFVSVFEHYVRRPSNLILVKLTRSFRVAVEVLETRVALQPWCLARWVFEKSSTECTKILGKSLTKSGRFFLGHASLITAQPQRQAKGYKIRLSVESSFKKASFLLFKYSFVTEKVCQAWKLSVLH